MLYTDWPKLRTYASLPRGNCRGVCCTSALANQSELHDAYVVYLASERVSSMRALCMNIKVNGEIPYFMSLICFAGANTGGKFRQCIYY